MLQDYIDKHQIKHETHLYVHDKVEECFLYYFYTIFQEIFSSLMIANKNGFKLYVLPIIAFIY